MIASIPSDARRQMQEAVNTGKNFTFTRQLKATLFSSWLNTGLLPLVVTGFVLRYASTCAPAIFVVNFFAIILLGSWISYATRELALRAGNLAMALVVALSNVIQLIVTIIALVQGQILILQTSLVGSVVSNMVLLTGLSLVLGGYNRWEQYFDIDSVNIQLNYLFLIIAVVGTSTMWKLVAEQEKAYQLRDEKNLHYGARAISISRAASIVLIIGHIIFLYWVWSMPVRLFTTESQTGPQRPGRSVKAIKRLLPDRIRILSRNRGKDVSTQGSEARNKQSRKPKISTQLAIFILVTFTILIGFCATFVVESVDSLTQTTMKQSFVGLILFPIFSYNFDAILLAREDRLDYTFVVTVGGSLQILALILPLAVLIGWIADKPEMVVVFDGFQVTIMLLSCVAMKYTCAYGSTTWLQGVILIIFYIIIAVAAWFYPDPLKVPSL